MADNENKLETATVLANAQIDFFSVMMQLFIQKAQGREESLRNLLQNVKTDLEVFTQGERVKVTKVRVTSPNWVVLIGGDGRTFDLAGNGGGTGHLNISHKDNPDLAHYNLHFEAGETRCGIAIRHTPGERLALHELHRGADKIPKFTHLALRRRDDPFVGIENDLNKLRLGVFNLELSEPSVDLDFKK